MNELELFQAEVSDQCSAEQARELTDRIKLVLDGTWGLVKAAYISRAWAALGYSTWDDYCTREFGTSRLRLPREERGEVVTSLRDSGLSARAIAAATGLGLGTVGRALADSGVPNGTPESESAAPPQAVHVERADGGAQSAGTPTSPSVVTDDRPAPPPRTLGVDGKSYQASRPAATRAASSPADPPPLLFPARDDEVVDGEIVDELARRRSGDLGSPDIPAPHRPSLAVSNFLAEDPAFQDKAYLAEFSRCLAHSDDFMEFDPERIGWLASDLTMATLAQHLIHVQQFIARAQAARSKVRVIPGGRA